MSVQLINIFVDPSLIKCQYLAKFYLYKLFVHVLLGIERSNFDSNAV